jgi:hypothetical protein
MCISVDIRKDIHYQDYQNNINVTLAVFFTTLLIFKVKITLGVAKCFDYNGDPRPNNYKNMKEFIYMSLYHLIDISITCHIVQN